MHICQRKEAATTRKRMKIRITQLRGHCISKKDRADAQAVNESPRVYQKLTFSRALAYEQETWIFPEVRERAVRIVLTSEQDHNSRWSAITSGASEMGCTPETLRAWINKSGVDAGIQPDTTCDEAERIKTLER